MIAPCLAGSTRPLRLFVLVLLTVGGCDTPDPGGDVGTGVDFSLVAEPLLSRNGSNTRIGPVVAARGDVVLAGPPVHGNGPIGRIDWVSTDGGANWRRINPAAGGVGDVLFESDDAAFVRTGNVGIARWTFTDDVIRPLNSPVGAAQPLGVRTTDGALVVRGYQSLHAYRDGTWTSTAFPADNPTSGIHHGLAMTPDGTVYVLTPASLYATTDGGVTWDVRTATPYFSSIPRLMALPDGSVLIYSADTGHPEAVRLVDGGRTADPSFTVPAGGNFADLYAGDDGALYAGPFRSRNAGRSWSRFFDHDALGVPSGYQHDHFRYTQGRFYVYLDEVDLFRADDPVTRMEYAGGLGTAEAGQAAGRDASDLRGVPLAGGGFLLDDARYDPARRRWVWHPTPGPPQALPDGRLAVHRANAVWFSSDDGRTWGAPRTVWAEAPFHRYRFSGGGPLVPTSDGALYAASQWEYAEYSPDPPRPRVALAVSRDGGLTWSAAALEDADTYPFVRAASGTVLYAPGRETGQGRRSRDGGQTWEASPAHTPVGQLPSGEVLFVGDARSNNVLSVLERDGETVRTLGPLLLDGQPANAQGVGLSSAVLRLDAQGYVYVACGRPLVQPCRSARPLR